MHSPVGMSEPGQGLCLGGTPPVGSLGFVYMMCLDTGKPRAALLRQNSPHNQQPPNPKWK